MVACSSSASSASGASPTLVAQFDNAKIGFAVQQDANRNKRRKLACPMHCTSVEIHQLLQAITTMHPFADADDSDCGIDDEVAAAFT